MVESNLPEKKTINGFPYELVERDAHRAIYKQTISPTREHYEVFKIQVSNPRKDLASMYAKKGKSSDHLPDRAEVFPTNSDFGKTAWSCFTFDAAKRMYDEIQPQPIRDGEPLRKLERAST